MKTDLSKFDNSWYDAGSSLKRGTWFMINALIFQNPIVPFVGLKRLLLRVFGAKIGKGVIIKPTVNIKYPWNLTIEDYAWIGEHVWIDSLGKVFIGKSACISQGALILSGNHDYKKENFDLIIKEIRIEDGVWIGAKSVVCQGVVCKSHAVLTVGSVATKDLEAYSIYQGTPAVKLRERI